MPRNLLFYIYILLLITNCHPINHSSKLDGVSIDKRNLINKSELTVCWMHTHWSQIEERTAIEEYTIEQFDLTNVKLKPDWTLCKDLKDYDISVFLYDDPDFLADQSEAAKRVRMEDGDDSGNSRVRAWGKFLRNHPYGVVFNSTAFGRNKSGQYRWNLLKPEGQNNLMLSLALHELGHAVGLVHEHAHPEETCDSFDQRIKESEVVVGEYDEKSIMNYCLFAYRDSSNQVLYLDSLNETPLTFSENDIEVIDSLYDGSESQPHIVPPRVEAR